MAKECTFGKFRPNGQFKSGTNISFAKIKKSKVSFQCFNDLIIQKVFFRKVTWDLHKGLEKNGTESIIVEQRLNRHRKPINDEKIRETTYAKKTDLNSLPDTKKIPIYVFLW